jgi:hypothetical protein
MKLNSETDNYARTEKKIDMNTDMDMDTDMDMGTYRDMIKTEDADTRHGHRPRTWSWPQT